METKLSQGSVILAMNKHRELCAMTTTGGVCLNMDDLSRAITVAEKQVKEMHESVENALKYNGVDQFQINVEMGDNILPKVEGDKMEDNLDSHDNNVDLTTVEYGGAIAPIINEQDWGVSDLISGIRDKIENNGEKEMQEEQQEEDIPWSELSKMKD